MSPEKQRIAIARACGWRPMPFDYWLDPQGGHHGCFGAGDELKFLPDYLNDLNAMRVAEKALTAEQQPEYARRLHAWTTKLHYLHADFELLHTPAAIRAEEFLRTLNLWEGTKP